MKFAVELGVEEKFRLEYESHHLLGTTVIKINDAEVKRTGQRLFLEPKRESHRFEIGHQEPMSIRIEKERKLFFGQRNRVFVNERLVKCFEGF